SGRQNNARTQLPAAVAYLNRWLNMRILCMMATLVVVSACDPGAIKKVRLQVPALTGSENKVPLENHTIRDAVGIVDAVVKRYGLGPDTNEQTRETRVIRRYAAGPL